MAGEKSKILIIGSTGYIGKHIVTASAKMGHPTFALVRDVAPSDPAKAELLQSFKDLGVTLLKGDLYDHENLVKAIKQVDVVISPVGGMQIMDQTKIIDAIVEAGNVKRYLPSEFGGDVDHVNAVEPAKSLFSMKTHIRRAVEAAGVPYTYICCNGFAGYLLPVLGQVDMSGFPTESVTILGDGNVKCIIVEEGDVAAYTIKAVDDPRTLNKSVILRPPANTLSHNELVSIWEKKSGKTLKRVYVSEEELHKQIQEAPMPLNIMLSIGHSVYIIGDHTNFEIDPAVAVEGTALYPDVKYTTVDEYLNRFL